MKPPIRVILVDDEAIFRLGIKTLLKKEKDITVVGQAESGEYALTLLDTAKPDVVLADLHLGFNQLEGPELVRQLKIHAPNIHCISLTIENDPFLLLQLLDAGADAIIRKSGIDLIKNTIRRVHAGGHIIQPEISYSIIQALRERQVLERLSESELDTFRRMGLGEDDRTIAKNSHISRSTIKSRLVTLKRKLNVETKSELIQLYQKFFPKSERDY